MARKGESTKVAQDKSETVAALPLACSNEQAAVEFLEAQRWGDTPRCVHCGSVSVYQMKDAKTGERSKRFLWRCRDCKKQYTVRVGMVFEESRIPLRHWCYAFWAGCSSKKGVSAMQIKRMTGLSYKSALFLMHRIRFAMDSGGNRPKLGGVIEADETYVGGKKLNQMGNYGWKGDGKIQRFRDKVPVFAVVERGGEVRARVMPSVTAANLRRSLLQTADQSSYLMTDSSNPYRHTGRMYKSHGIVNHSIREYVKPNTFPKVHTNTIEGFFSILKRGINGTFHAVSKKHLHRYVSEFEFRYNSRHVDDGERTVKAIQQAEGKRLMYRDQVRAAG